jgi:hypothetical protein
MMASCSIELERDAIVFRNEDRRKRVPLTDIKHAELITSGKRTRLRIDLIGKGFTASEIRAYMIFASFFGTDRIYLVEGDWEREDLDQIHQHVSLWDDVPTEES